MIRRYYLLIFIQLFFLPELMATHNRAGEITYTHMGGHTYQFTVRICTNEGPGIADRPELEIWYGDGDRDTIPRLSSTMVPPVGSWQGSENIYIVSHTYPGPGTYNIEVLDPNRNNNIINIVSSVSVAFCLRTQLVISPFLGANNSCVPQEFPCPEIGCVGKKYCYNSAAYDPDGDSLSYELVPCLGANANNSGCASLGGVYTFPSAHGGGILSVAPDGTVCWDAPTMQGEFNIAIRITEWRSGIIIGTMLRDIQIIIRGACNNDPPVLSPLTDTCLVAGQSLSFPVTATDPNGDAVVITNYGQPFSLTPAATFTANTFNWTTDCAHVRNAPYIVYFIGEDNNPTVTLIDVVSMNIRVIPPPVDGLALTSFQNTMVLNWNPNSCNKIVGYKIYRKTGAGSPQTGNCCDEFTAEELGYTLIGNVSGINNTTFADNSGLVIGEMYCYVVVAYTQDETFSCPSAEICDQLQMVIPVITNVSVENTDATAGSNLVRWFDPWELDTTIGGQWFYKVYKGNGFTNATQLVYTTPLSASLSATEKQVLIDTLNTIVQAHTYRVELWNRDAGGNDNLIGPTNSASSVFLTVTPSDNKNTLSWTQNVPWTNFNYEIYRETSPGSTIFNLIGNTTSQSYIDDSLTNGILYCYKVLSYGSYSAPEIPAPLLNWSQRVCSAPVDQTAPCPPVISINSDCVDPLNQLSWNNPNDSCADDVMSYNLYYTPVEGEAFTLIMTFNSSSDTSFNHTNNGSVAGCYYITAVDSVHYGNESIASNIVCADNCPQYFLPNVFSPNGDGDNDFFVPFPYMYVDSVDMKIFNRWGELIFETSDPDIRWDGKSMVNNKDLTEGVYFYHCIVYTKRLSGADPVSLHGFVHLYRNKGGSTQ
jgi:gliding motility-associated-like protein